MQLVRNWVWKKSLDLRKTSYGNIPESLLDVATDVSYNNRPVSGFESATQAFAPLIETVTNKNYPVIC